jgi:hypothetical protein
MVENGVYNTSPRSASGHVVHDLPPNLFCGIHVHRSHLLRPSTGGEGLKSRYPRCVLFSVTSTIYDASSRSFQLTHWTFTLMRDQLLDSTLHALLFRTYTEPWNDMFCCSVFFEYIMANKTHLSVVTRANLGHRQHPQ